MSAGPHIKLFKFAETVPHGLPLPLLSLFVFEVQRD